MEALINKNTATNAMEAKTIVDNFLLSLTDEVCFKLMSAAMANDKIYQMPYNISYAIGASSYYYGAECKVFCSDHISITILNKGFKHIKTLQA